MPTPTRHPRERGSLLVPVLILTLVLGGFSVALLQEGLAERVSIRHHETSLFALEIAEKGLVESELEIRALSDPGGDGIGVVSGTYGGGTYEVSAQPSASLPDRWTLIARAQSGLSVRRIEVGLRRRKAGYFVEGLFSKAALRLNGIVSTDSYDSRLGTWAQQATNSDAAGPYARGHGDIGSNEGIGLIGSAVTVRGNAIPGPLSQVSRSGQPTVWGDTVPRQRNIDLPPPSESAFQAAYLHNDNASLFPGNGKGGGKITGYDPATMALQPKGQTQVDLLAGTYFFTSIDLSGGTSLVIHGPVKIYVTGNVDLTGGGLINETGVPASCQIFAQPYSIPAGFDPSGAEVRLTGSSEGAMALYAPDRPVTILGTSDFYGSVVGANVTVSGDAAFHYDEALGAVSGGSSVYMERLYWRELTELRR